jgi:nicotinate-nucleotide--dimethylbenzimidazole phosphoribosyltransferase
MITSVQIQQHIDQKTKPLGALGVLEDLAAQLAHIQQTLHPQITDPQVMVCAADHGIAAQGVSAFPQAVTQQMVLNMLAGGAAINVFAQTHGVAVQVIDAGVVASTDHPKLIQRRMGAGTQDFSKTWAMNTNTAQAALDAGAELVRKLPGNTVAFGEMGIANTSSAAVLLHHFAKTPWPAAVGRGTGLDDAQLAHKQAVLS